MLAEDAPTASPRRQRRWVILALGIAGVILGGWLLASSFQSTAQREANAAPPPPSPVVAVVTSGTLEDETSYAGVVEPSSQTTITFSASEGAAAAVVTGHPLDVGATIGDGDLITEVNGRPVFAVSSAFPFYRDIGEGDSGPDVRALQEMLAHRGYGVDADGNFGPRTQQAVRDWYRDHRYAPLTRPTEIVPADPATDRSMGASPEDSVLTTTGEVAFVPLSEIQGIPSLPTSVVRGVAVGSRVGSTGTGDVTLGTLDKVVTVSADPAEIVGLSEGVLATVVAGDVVVEATVTSIRPPSGQDSPPSSEVGSQSSVDPGQASSASVVLTPSSSVEIPIGASVRVLVTDEIVPTESLLVPAIAVTDRGGENQVVQLHVDDGSFVEVRVTVLGVLNGQAAIQPEQPGQLEVGDEVKVG